MPPQRILIAANSAWNHWNYRRALVQMLQEAGYEIVLTAADDSYSDRLEAPFFPLRQAGRRPALPLEMLHTAAELARLMREQRPALCLFFTTSMNITGNWAARRTRTPCISVVEGLGYVGSDPWRWRLIGRPLFRSALRQAHRVLFLNADDQRELVEQGVVTTRQSVRVPGPGVDEEHFAPRSSPGNARTVFLYCGRLLSNKGLPLFLQVAQMMHSHGLPAEFRVLGSPDPNNPASLSEQEMMRRHQEGWVRYLGADDDVRPHLAAADAVVLPTYYREGMPRVLLEAMCMEKIVVATDVPGCREVVVPGQTGFLIPPRDTRALEQVLCYVLTLSAQERAAIGKAARQSVAQQFSNRVVLPKYAAVIEEVFEQLNGRDRPTQ